MKIKKLYLQAFGKFIDSTFSFSPGLNLIYGRNEAGKSTIGEFIFSMLYGQKKYGVKKRVYLNSYTNNLPWYHNLYQGILLYSIDGKEYRVERNFHPDSEYVRIFEESTGQEVTDNYPYDARKELQFLYEQIGLNERNFINSIYVGQNDMRGLLYANQDDILEELIAKSIYGIEGENGERTLREIIRGLERKKKDIGTSKSKSKPLGHTYQQLREKLKIKFDLERKLQSFNDYQNSLSNVNEELKILRAKMKKLSAEGQRLKGIQLQEKIAAIEDLVEDKMDLLEYIQANFPLSLREESIENLYQQRKRNRRRSKNVLILQSLLAGIGLFTIFWALLSFHIWVQGFLLLGVLSLFLYLLIDGSNINKNEELLFDKIERILQYQDAQLELKRLETQIKDTLEGQTLETLKKKLEVFDVKPAKISKEEHLSLELLDMELMKLSEKEKDLVREQTIVQTKIDDCKWNPAILEEVEGDIYALEQDIKAMEEDIQAIEIAIATLETIEKNGKIKWLPNITKKTEENIYKITKKYHTIKIDDQYQIKTIEPVSGKLVPIDQLSQGTINQFYLSLRISLIQSLSPQSINLPIILDEPFLHFDDRRFNESMDLLRILSSRHQILIFSSQEREKGYLKENKFDYNYIEL